MDNDLISPIWPFFLSEKASSEHIRFYGRQNSIRFVPSQSFNKGYLDTVWSKVQTSQSFEKKLVQVKNTF